MKEEERDSRSTDFGELVGAGDEMCQFLKMKLQ